MPINNPPITENATLNLTLFQILQELNLVQQQNLRLLQDIRDATSLADLKVRIDKK